MYLNLYLTSLSKWGCQLLIALLLLVTLSCCSDEELLSSVDELAVIEPESAIPSTGTVYYIKNRKSGKYVDVKDFNHSNGGIIHQWNYTGALNQQWEAISVGSSEYRLKNIESGKSFDIAGNSTANKAYLQQYSYGGASNQKFTFTSAGSGYYMIKAVHSGKALDGTGQTVNGTRIWQWTYSASNQNQHWLFESVNEDTANGSVSYSNPGDIPKFKDALSKAKLQLPTSTTVATAAQLLAGYSSSYFQVANNEDIAFYQTGASKRTELRFENNFVVTSGSRTAHANLKFGTQVGEEATFLQIHDDANAGNGPNKPLLRIYRSLSSGHIHAAVKTDDGGDATTHYDCGSAPTGYFDCDITLSGGTMTIKINGVTKVTKSVTYWDYPSYWKAGVYNQYAGGTTTYFNELTWN
ncbi:RICIN domain-containing protein [Reichenbachiella agarivorans]|uniref:RICIN domain-containing protein n=1 Tax=Reichenbachiella agarivorans TaxID=2979464 RepID=A0ABY6CPR9_9BACT|nr:RICIN domain-containing protein [Reichenbachiella agarivorans]UXP32492.1 RICIN domain-containing protein [Reichenbachiella agarivorans]